MTDTSGVTPTAPATIPPTVAGLISSVFNTTSGSTPPTDEGKDESFFQEMGDKFRQSVDVVNSTAKLVGSTITGALGQATGAGAAVAPATGQAQAGITQETAAKQQQDLLEGAARDKLVNDNLSVATAEGTTPQQMIDRAARINATTATLQSENDELSKRAGTSIFDDPLSYIQNLFTTPFIKRKHDADLESLKEDLSIQNQQQIASQDAAKVNAGIDAVHGAVYTKSIMDQEAGIALQKKAQATIESAKFESSNAAVTASISDADMNNAVKQSNVAGTALNEARTNLGFDLTAGGKTARSELIAQRARDLVQADQDNKLASIAMGRGGQPIPETEIANMTTAQKKAFVDLRNSVAIGTGAGLTPAESPLGSTPVDAANNTKVFGLKAPMASQNDTIKFINDSAAEVAQHGIKGPNGTNINIKALPPEDQSTIINNAVLGKYGALYNNIPATGSILSPGPLSSILSIPVVGQTDLGKALAPLAVNKLAPIDYDTVAAAASKLIDSGMPIPVVAAQMKTLGNGMSGQVNQIRGLARANLPPLLSDQFPNFRVTMRDALGNSHNVDLNNQSAIETFLTRNEIAKKTGPSPFLGITAAPPLSGQ